MIVGCLLGSIVASSLGITAGLYGLDSARIIFGLSSLCFLVGAIAPREE